jgi:hypothetical protein
MIGIQPVRSEPGRRTRSVGVTLADAAEVKREGEARAIESAERAVDAGDADVGGDGCIPQMGYVGG